MIRDAHVQNIKQDSNKLKSEPILELVLQRIRLRAKRRIAWLRKLWREEGDSGGQLAVTHAEIDACLDHRDSPEAEYNWYASDDTIRQLNVTGKMANEAIERIYKTAYKLNKASYDDALRVVQKEDLVGNY